MSHLSTNSLITSKTKLYRYVNLHDLIINISQAFLMWAKKFALNMLKLCDKQSLMLLHFFSALARIFSIPLSKMLNISYYLLVNYKILVISSILFSQAFLKKQIFLHEKVYFKALLFYVFPERICF